MNPEQLQGILCLADLQDDFELEEARFKFKANIRPLMSQHLSA